MVSKEKYEFRGSKITFLPHCLNRSKQKNIVTFLINLYKKENGKFINFFIMLIKSQSYFFILMNCTTKSLKSSRCGKKSSTALKASILFVASKVEN